MTKSGSTKKPRGPQSQGGPTAEGLSQFGKQKNSLNPLAGKPAIGILPKQATATSSGAAPVTVQNQADFLPPAQAPADPLSFSLQISPPKEFDRIRTTIGEHFAQHCMPGVELSISWPVSGCLGHIKH